MVCDVSQLSSPPGLGVYSSGSESETEDSPDKPHTSSRGGGRESRSKSKAVAEKMPKPEEIAAAFKDTKAGGGGGGGEGFMPVPHSVQEKHRETVRTSSTSSSSKLSHTESVFLCVMLCIVHHSRYVSVWYCGEFLVQNATSF